MRKSNEAKGPHMAGRAKRLLTVAEIAALDQCSEKTVRRAIADGLLEIVRIGPSKRTIRITEKAHLRYRNG